MQVTSMGVAESRSVSRKRCIGATASLVCALLLGLASACGTSPSSEKAPEPSQMVDSGSWYRRYQWPHDGHPYETEHFVVYSDGASLEARQRLARASTTCGSSSSPSPVTTTWPMGSGRAFARVAEDSSGTSRPRSGSRSPDRAKSSGSASDAAVWRVLGSTSTGRSTTSRRGSCSGGREAAASPEREREVVRPPTTMMTRSGRRGRRAAWLRSRGWRPRSAAASRRGRTGP